MDYLNSFIRVYFICCLFLLFLSCDKFNEPEQVTSGVNQGRLVLSRRCASGSFNIYNVGTNIHSISGFPQTNTGNKINITGRVSNAAPCYQGPVSFTCSGYVAVDQNTAFICDTGTVHGGSYTAGSSYRTVTSTTGHTVPGGNYTQSVPGRIYSHGVPTSTGRAFLKGEFYNYGNGQKANAYITVGSPSPLAPQAVCRFGFSCL